MDDEPMWAADRVVALTPGSAFTIPKTANEFAIKGSSNSDTDKIMAQMDAMTMKMDAQYKEFQSRSKQLNPDHNDDDIPIMEEDSKVPLILGRPFLYTADAVIRVKHNQLNLGVRAERMVFHIDSTMKHSYSNDDTCFSIDVIDEILKEDFDALLDERSSPELLKHIATSKKKQSKRKLVLHDESDESEGEPSNRPTGIKKRKPKAVVIQEPPSVPVKKTPESSRKLKGIKLLSDASQFKIDTHRAIKASKRESIFQHQTGGSSEGAGLRPEVSDELTRNFANLDEGAGTSPEEYLLAYKDEKPKDILWYSTNKDESDNDDDNEEDESDDDASIVIKKFDNERTDTNVEDQDDGELKAEEEQKEDDQAGDEQVVVPVSTTQKEKPYLLQSTSSHSVSSNFEPFHVVKLSVIPETTQQPPSTPPTPPLTATKIPSTQVSNSEVVNSVVQIFTKLEQAVKELKEADHSTAILALIKSQVPSVVEGYLGSSLPDALKKALQSHTEELKKELSEKRDYKDII
ncbi:hypothetical protein Tco_0664623 [Tanacetum coccineum]